MTRASLVGILALALLPAPAGAASASHPWLSQENSDALSDRFPAPKGYIRKDASPGSFGHWLRGLPLKPGRPPVRLFNGQLKGNQSVHAAVIDIDVGDEDLQQCADAVIRLRAEFLFSQGREDDVCFRFTSGDKSAWTAWKGGSRPIVAGNKVTWVRRAGQDASHPNFRDYLTTTYRWAGTASLSKELIPVPDARRVESGDVFIQGGFPGHAVLVVDVAANPEGERIFLLAQSYMPAQEMHVLRNAGSVLDPWYSAEEVGDLHTPEWTFSRRSLKRFSEKGCP